MWSLLRLTIGSRCISPEIGSLRILIHNPEKLPRSIFILIKLFKAIFKGSNGVLIVASVEIDRDACLIRVHHLCRLITIARHRKGSDSREEVQLRWQLRAVQLRCALSCAVRLASLPLLRFLRDTGFIPL